MKRIIVLLCFMFSINTVYAGQPGAISKPMVPAIPNSANLKNIKIDFDALAKSGEIKANQLLVKFKEASTQFSAPTMQASVVEKMKSFFKPMKNLVMHSKLLSQWKVVSFEQGKSLNEMYSILIKDPNVEYVVPNLRLKIQATEPNDLNAELWGLNNTGQSFDITNDQGSVIETVEPVAGIDINAPEAWDIRTDASDVVVAVIDTGIDYNHSELSANIWINQGEIAGNGIDDDSNGYIDDVHGYDFVNRDGDPMDDHGHGTHCSGTIAASANNGTGITGVAWSAQLMAVKILGANGSGYTSDIIEGILYAADNGAAVSNNSYGMPLSDAVIAELMTAPYSDAIQAAGNSGMVFAAAAGNEYTNLDEYGFSVPASLNLPNIISVAAIGPQGTISEFSNRGYHHTDIAAPGEFIKSTLPGEIFAFFGGTSMATPHVAGVAALMKAEAPQLDPVSIKSILMNTVTPNDNLVGLVRSNGILNAYGALSALKASCDSFTATPSQHRDAGRAYSCNSWYICANGSNEQIGFSFSSTNITLTEKKPDFFVTDGSCDGALDIPPTITLEGKVEEYIPLGGSYNPQTATSFDVEDGDLTANIQISSNLDTGNVGNYIIEYRVTDSAGNETIETRLVHVVDDPKPQLMLLGHSCNFFYGCSGYTTTVVNQPYVDPGSIGWDVVDGDISERVTFSGEILDNLDQIGNRGDLYYEVTDLDGNLFQASYGMYRHVIVLDQNHPLFLTYDEASEEYFRIFKTYRRDETEGHPEFTPHKPLAIDHVDGHLSEDNILVDNPADYSVTGDYEVTFTVTDSEGYSDQVKALVQVIEDVTPPEIINYCDEHKFVEVNSDWEATEFCVVAKDDLDPKPTRVFESNVDITTPGDYEVVYTVSDFAGNEDTWVMVVTVVDGTTPSVTSSSAQGGPRSMTISGTAFDPENNIEKVEVKLHTNVEGWVVAEGTDEWSITLNDIDPANYTAWVRITDSTGLKSDPYKGVGAIHGIKVWDSKIETVDVTVDGNDILVSGTASDANGDLDRVELNVEIGGVHYTGIVAEGTYNWSYVFENIDKGEYTIGVYAIDAVGHYSDQEVVIAKVGFNPPSIDAFNVIGGEQTVTVAGTASDIDGDLARVLVGIGNAGDWYTANGTENFNLTLNGIEPGFHEVRIWALDAEENGTVVTSTVEVLPLACADYSATLTEHESAGRAYSETTTEGETCFGSFCFGGTEVTRWYATGSNEELGTNGSTVVSLIEEPAGSGNYIHGVCPAVPQQPVIESYQISELNYNRAVVTGVASDANNDIDRVVLGLGAVSGIICEGTTNFSCVLDYSIHDITVGVPFGVSLVAYDSRETASNVEQFTITRPEQQASVPPVIGDIQQTREGTVEIVTVTVTDVDDDLDRVVLYRIDDIGVVECTNTTGDQFRCEMQLQGTDYATMTWKVRAIDLAENITDSAEFTVVWEEAPSCFTDTNTNHEASGRAYLQYNVLYYANGSDDYLGMSSDTTSLEQQGQPGNWVKVSSCP